jgi:hypothetical protein
MKKPNALASALRNSGSVVPASPVPQQEPTPRAVREQAPSRNATKAITVHFPEDVRRQLKVMSGEMGRTMEDLVAEGLNLLFVRHRKPEIAPRKNSK